MKKNKASQCSCSLSKLISWKFISSHQPTYTLASFLVCWLLPHFLLLRFPPWSPHLSSAWPFFKTQTHVCLLEVTHIGGSRECMWAPQGQSVLILLCTVLSTSPAILQRALNGGKGILWLSTLLPPSGLPSLNSTQPKIPRFERGEETEGLCPTSWSLIRQEFLAPVSSARFEPAQWSWFV